MSTLTKEWLLKTIAELEEERDATPGVVNEDAAMALAAMKLALASLEAEPVISHLGSKNALDAIVAFIKSNRNPTLKDYNEVSERLFQDNCHGLSNHVIEYIKQIGEELEELRSTQDTAPPAPASVPDVVSWEDVPEEITEDDIALASAWAHGFNQCRAAMLRGAEPVTTDYKLPEGWVAVPIEPTSEMQSAAAGAIRFDTTPINKLWTGNAVYKAMIAAAPQQEVK
ncbi:hypothetical protein [Enterobacter hormaechei]|uniref:hypothetical protein n=1 Tax=Enterobacter hormaechei TaxID=158836 RepID=UPI000796A3F2|nr:hypothetical protein [Enterobacter hormaechei]MCU3018298.1 hypothetical protein [Enterobacter hormaechei subsp. oharae]MCU3615035.1 hypothetical protein [Enterobacter hormaechei subsp. oharae]CZV16840.1 Uncharacterised protein [Enterobacter hormaechei]CZV50327.1 Uncharacterised protein [Enterobacter hormaechei]CZW00727.1 Uncharacterised protein [Enterobacter hormaechei]